MRLIRRPHRAPGPRRRASRTFSPIARLVRTAARSRENGIAAALLGPCCLCSRVSALRIARAALRIARAARCDPFFARARVEAIARAGRRSARR